MPLKAELERQGVVIADSDGEFDLFVPNKPDAVSSSIVLRFHSILRLTTSFFRITTYASASVKPYVRLTWDCDVARNGKYGSVTRASTQHMRCSPKNFAAIVALIVDKVEQARLKKVELICAQDEKRTMDMRIAVTIPKYKHVMAKLNVPHEPSDYNFHRAEYKVGSDGTAQFAAKLTLTGDQWLQVAALINL